MIELTQKELNTLIDLMSSGNFKGDRVAIELAKYSPTLFLSIAQKIDTETSGTRDVLISVIYNIKDSKNIDAIKTVRTDSGFGLKEAKDIVDNVRQYMIARNFMVGEGYSVPCRLVSVQQDRYFDALIKTVEYIYE